MNRDHFLRLKTLVAFEIDRYRETLKRLSAAHFPSKVAVHLIEMLREYLLEREQSLSQITIDFEIEPIGAAARLQSEHRKILEKFWYLTVIEESRTENVPWSIIPTIERVARQLIPDHELLTTGTTELNYSIRWNTNANKGLGGFIVLSLPKIHRANPFLHVLIGHEFFHPLLEPFFEKESKNVSAVFLEGCIKLLKDQGETEDLFTKPRLDRLVEVALHIWKRALEELMCDIGCGALFGPAALLSFSYFAISQNIDEQPSQNGQWYPPWRYRLRTLVSYVLDVGGPNKTLDSFRQLMVAKGLEADWGRLSNQLELVRQLTKENIDVDKINENPLLTLVYDGVKQSLDQAWEYVCAMTGPVSDKWPSAMQQVPSLLGRLESRIPPGEFKSDEEPIGKEAELTAINMAGWLYLLRKEHAISLPDFHRTCHLLLKAYEDSEMKRAFATELNN